MSVSGISILAAFHGAVLAVALLRVRFEETRPYRWLSALLVILSALLILSPDSGVLSSHYAWEAGAVLYYLVGPTLLAFLRSITGVALSARVILLLCLPATVLLALFGLSYLPVFYDSPTGYLLSEFLYEWNWIGAAALEFVCIVLSFMAIASSKNRALEASAGDEPMLARRLKLFLGVYALFFALDCAQSLVGTYQEQPGIMYAVAPNILSALWFALVAYLLIAGTDRYRRFQDAATPLKKYSRSGLSDSEVIELLQRAEQYAQLNEFFCRDDCTLPVLAEALGVTVHDLSQAINFGSKTNFAGFVNRFRVDRAKELLCDDSHERLNILQVALESGFTSKATFNRVFKDITGDTPTAYRNTQK